MHRHAVLLLIAAAVGARASGPHVIPNVADDAIRIDGRCSEWETIPNATRLDLPEQVALHAEHWRGVEDLSAVVHLAWTDAALFLAVEVTDDALGADDRVELLLDATPDADPERTGFGDGQFRIAFATGDAGAVAVTQRHPAGRELVGAHAAYAPTGAGWTLEASIPFMLLGMEPAPGAAVACEVLLLDADPGQAQQTHMTIAPRPWFYSRTRLLPMPFGDAAGHTPETQRTCAVAEEISLRPGEELSVPFDPPAIPEATDVLLSLKARIDTEGSGGRRIGLKLAVNGHPLDPERLSNRAPEAVTLTGDRVQIVSSDGRLRLPYCGDFVSYDHHPVYAFTGGVRASEFEFRITDLLVAEGNTLTLTSMLDDATGRNVVVGDVHLSLRPAAEDTGLETSGGELPIIMPQTVSPVPYTISVDGATVRVAVAGEEFAIQSRFSAPDGLWKSGSCEFYTHSRRITEQDEAILIHDTFKNLTDDPVPIIQEHRCVLGERPAKAWVAGLSPPGGKLEKHEPANPSVYAATEHAGVGLLALNDILQVHVKQWVERGTVGLADDCFVLKPRAEYTAEWAILPTAEPDFYSFVNAARRLRGANFTLRHQFGFLSASPKTAALTDEQLRDFVINKGLTMAMATINHPRYNGLYAHGTAFQQVDHANYAEHHERLRRLCPGIGTGVYFHCFLDPREETASLYRDDRLLDANGTHPGYTPGSPYRVYIPMLENGYGPAVARNIDIILGECRADAVYWDELSGTSHPYHYGEPWDGCSGQINPVTFRLGRLKSSLTLLSLPFRTHHVERIMARAGFIANGQPHTRTMADLHYQCFVETASISNCARALLYSPVALGDHQTEKTPLDAYHNMLRALDYGCLYNWYGEAVVPEHPTLAGSMFPITPIELHEGYIIGEERIVTNRSGLYGWNTTDRHGVHVFDGRGREALDFNAPTRTIDGVTFTELRLPKGFGAVIVRIVDDL